MPDSIVLYGLAAGACLKFNGQVHKEATSDLIRLDGEITALRAKKRQAVAALEIWLLGEAKAWIDDDAQRAARAALDEARQQHTRRP